MVTVKTSYASDCAVELNKCSATVNAAKVYIKDMEIQIQNYKDDDQLQKQLIKDQKDKLESPLHDPIKVAAGTTILILILEIATGHIK